jgi:hypothetical protein
VAQRAARTNHIEVLREYREAGVFPHNHVAPQRAVPVFVDGHGTHCAVGYLLMRGGRDELVARISGSRNLAAVPELADEPELIAWLADAGLTVAEAARIQPWYGPLPTEEPAASASYVAASLIGAAVGGGMIAWNTLGPRDEHRRLAGMLGIGVGAADITLAAIGARLDRQPGREIDAAHVFVNLGVGLLSGVLGARTLRAADLEPPATPAALGADHASPQRLHWQLAHRSPGRAGGAGMRVDVRF